MHKLTRYKWGLFRHFCESFPNAYYDVPGLIKDANGAWIKAADVEGVLEEAKDVAILLRAYIAMRTHPGCLENDPDYVKATRLLARIESAK